MKLIQQHILEAWASKNLETVRYPSTADVVKLTVATKLEKEAVLEWLDEVPRRFDALLDGRIAPTSELDVDFLNNDAEEFIVELEEIGLEVAIHYKDVFPSHLTFSDLGIEGCTPAQFYKLFPPPKDTSITIDMKKHDRLVVVTKYRYVSPSNITFSTLGIEERTRPSDVHGVYPPPTDASDASDESSEDSDATETTCDPSTTEESSYADDDEDSNTSSLSNYDSKAHVDQTVSVRPTPEQIANKVFIPHLHVTSPSAESAPLSNGDESNSNIDESHSSSSESNVATSSEASTSPPSAEFEDEQLEDSSMNSRAPSSTPPLQSDDTDLFPTLEEMTEALLLDIDDGNFKDIFG